MRHASDFKTPASTPRTFSLGGCHSCPVAERGESLIGVFGPPNWHSFSSSISTPSHKASFSEPKHPGGLMLCQQCSEGWSGSTDGSPAYGFVGRGEVRKLASLGLGSPNSDHPASL